MKKYSLAVCKWVLREEWVPSVMPHLADPILLSFLMHPVNFNLSWEPLACLNLLEADGPKLRQCFSNEQKNFGCLHVCSSHLAMVDFRNGMPPKALAPPWCVTLTLKISAFGLGRTS